MKILMYKIIRIILVILLFEINAFSNEFYSNSTSNISSQSGPLVLYYSFTGNANDESGNSNNGIVNGAILTSDKTGNPNNAYLFDGLNDEISVNVTSGLQSYSDGDHTYSAWIKLTSTNSVAKFIIDASTPNEANGDQRGIRLYSNQTPVFKWVTNVSSYTATSTNSLSVGTWHHIVGVLRGNTGELYVNGIKVATNTSTGTPSSITTMKIGQVSSGGTGDGSFSGIIDEVRIYNRALSELEIQQLYNPCVTICNQAVSLNYQAKTKTELESILSTDGLNSSQISNMTAKNYIYKVRVNGGGGFYTKTDMLICLDNKVPYYGVIKGTSDDVEDRQTQIGTDCTLAGLYKFNNLGWVNATSNIGASKLYMILDSKWGSDIDTYLDFWFCSETKLASFGYGLIDTNTDDFGSITVTPFELSSCIPILNITPLTQNVTNTAGNTTFVISNSGCGSMNWSVTCDASWLNVTPASGSNTGTITATYEANTSANPRLANITVTVSGLPSKVVTVTQLGNQASLTIGNGNGIVGSTVTVPVQATSISNLAGFQFTIDYDATKLSYLNCSNWATGISGQTVSTPQNGKITCVFADPSIALNIPSGKFFDINFTILEGSSGSASLTWSDNPTKRIFVNSSLTEIGCGYIDGSISIITGFTLSGTLTYANTNNTPLPKESIDLMNSSNQNTGNVLTDVSGGYSFLRLANGTYSLKPNITLPWGASGVNVIDILKFKQHVGNAIVLPAFSQRSGDVDGNGSLNIFDILKMMARMGDPSKVFTVGDWLYDNTSVTINNANVLQNIQALCYGDANSSYVPLSTKSAQDIFVVGNDNISILQNREIEVPFKINRQINNLAAVGLTFTYPDELFVIKNIRMASSNEDLYYTVIDGTIRIIFATLNAFDQKTNEALFNIQLGLKNNADPGNLGETQLKFSGFGDFADFGAREYPETRVIYAGITKDVLEQLTGNKEPLIYPNPAKNYVNISNVENLEISVYDVDGRKIKTVKGNSNPFMLNLNELKTGVYFVKIIRNENLINRKITIVK